VRSDTGTPWDRGRLMGYQGCDLRRGWGVHVDSPHELAWREALKELLDGDCRDIRDQTSWTAERFTTQVYQQLMAGKPRLAGARTALEYFGVPDVDRRSEHYAAAKQKHVVQLIEQGRFRAFPDALRFILAVKNSGIRVAASSSKTPSCSWNGFDSTPSLPNNASTVASSIVR
jgi:phosphoglycolate phosphatase-like HAD superfamily hydrolase